MNEELIEKIAKAIFDAENGLDGDCVAEVMFDNFRIEGQTADECLAEVMIVCRSAARAALSIAYPAIVEACAKVAEQHTKAPGQRNAKDQWRESIGQECAAAIRNMARAETEKSPTP